MQQIHVMFVRFYDKASKTILERAIWDQIRFRIAYIDVLVQKRRNSGALAMELRLSCTGPSKSYIFSISLSSFPVSHSQFSLTMTAHFTSHCPDLPLRRWPKPWWWSDSCQLLAWRHCGRALPGRSQQGRPRCHTGTTECDGQGPRFRVAP